MSSQHSGDNSQLLALAEGLGWPFEVKPLTYRGHETLIRLVALPSLSAVDGPSRERLAPPWPDLVISAGRATEAVAQWIRAHANSPVRLVYVGTPWSPPDRFDLVIATPQYRLADHPRILQNALPMHRVTPERLAQALAQWSPRLAHLPRPLIAVLAGGPSGPYGFSAAAGRRLGEAVSRMASEAGGSLLVSTSARTPDEAADALTAAISVPHHLHRVGASEDDNPLFGYLAMADTLIVTADSISMIAEACATGKPVLLFDTETGPRSMRAEETAGGLPPPHWRGANWSSTMFRLAMRFAPAPWSRDLRIVHRALIASGAASWLDAPRPHRPLAPQADLDRAVRRIRSLFAA